MLFRKLFRLFKRDSDLITFDRKSQKYKTITLPDNDGPEEGINYPRSDYEIEFNPKRLTMKIFSSFFYLIIFLSIFLNIVFFTLAFHPNTNLGILGVSRTMLAFQYDPLARSIAVNLTRECEDDTTCSFYKLVEYMNDFVYSNDGNTNSRLYPFEQTINDKSGDCENLSWVFAKLYAEIGGTVVVKCNKCHCYNIVNLADDIFESTIDDVFIYDATSGNVYQYDQWINDLYDHMCD